MENFFTISLLEGDVLIWETQSDLTAVPFKNLLVSCGLQTKALLFCPITEIGPLHYSVFYIVMAHSQHLL